MFLQIIIIAQFRYCRDQLWVRIRQIWLDLVRQTTYGVWLFLIAVPAGHCSDVKHRLKKKLSLFWHSENHHQSYSGTLIKGQDWFCQISSLKKNTNVLLLNPGSLILGPKSTPSTALGLGHFYLRLLTVHTAYYRYYYPQNWGNPNKETHCCILHLSVCPVFFQAYYRGTNLSNARISWREETVRTI